MNLCSRREVSNGYELETVQSGVVTTWVRAAPFSIVASSFFSECSASLRFWLIWLAAQCGIVLSVCGWQDGPQWYPVVLWKFRDVQRCGISVHLAIIACAALLC
jgi:hypothetical protein